METTNQVPKKNKEAPNPTGKGGFGDNPQNRSDGGWKKEDSISYQYNKFIRMSQKDFTRWEKENPEDERTVAQSLAFAAVAHARKKLDYLKEVTDRTEGKAPQKIEHAGEIETGLGKVADTLQSIYESTRDSDNNPEDQTEE